MKVKWWHTISSLKSEYRSRLTKNLPFIIINKWGEEALKDLFFSNVWCRMLPGAKIIERRFIIAGLFNHRTIIPAKGRLGPPGPGSPVRPGRPGEGGTTYRMFLCVKSCYCGFLRGRRRNSHNGVKLILKKTDIFQNISLQWTEIKKYIFWSYNIPVKSYFPSLRSYLQKRQSKFRPIIKCSILNFGLIFTQWYGRMYLF